MVEVGRLVDQVSRLVSVTIFALFFLENIKHFLGVDVIDAIRRAPPFDYEAIVAQYPWLFFSLSTGLALLTMVDQTILSRYYRDRVVPPLAYSAAISASIFSLSIALMMFLRDTALFWYYIYFGAISGLALVHILLIRLGILQEIKEGALPGAPLVEKGELVRMQSIYPVVERGRRRAIR